MISVRPLAAHDEKTWRRLWAAYLAFYKTSLPPSQADLLFQSLLMGAPHFALVAERDREVVGFAHCLPHASTWSASGYLYLEDLFVDASARGAGAGRALIEAVYRAADQRGVDRVYWHTETSNAEARSLYDKLASLSDFVQYRR
ncbi:MAG: GNAT family N-acetyltransferase [Hyphococcus sp.]